jgi:LuxR family maltose regulon positive regulatory protein
VLPLLCLASTLENFTAAYLTLARVRAIDGRHAEALQLIDYLHSMLESGSHPRFLAQVCYEKIRLHLLMHNPQRAHAVAVDFGLPALASQSYWLQSRTYDEAWEQLGFAQAALLMEDACYDECITLLDVLRSSAAQAGYVYRQVPLEAALACCHWCAGNRARAFDAMNRGFVLTRRFGFPRSVFDEAPLLREVIAAAVQDRKLCLLPAKYFSKFQDVFAVPPERMLQAQAQPKSTLPLEPLTDREIAMLRLLSQGLSNLEISAHSRIALSTAKWHLKNAFAKLDVGTRTGAIARARALQLIE